MENLFVRVKDEREREREIVVRDVLGTYLGGGYVGYRQQECLQEFRRDAVSGLSEDDTDGLVVPGRGVRVLLDETAHLAD